MAQSAPPPSQRPALYDRYVGRKEWGWYMPHGQIDQWTEHLKTDQPMRILEIGSFDGVSANMMLDVIFTHPQSHVTVIDPFLPDPTTPWVSDLTKSHFLQNIVIGHHENQITLVEGFSGEQLRRFAPESFDFVYVDGSHQARHVLEDAVLSFPLVKVGGVIGFDDYVLGDKTNRYGRPGPAIDAFETVYGDRLSLLFEYGQRFFRKIEPTEHSIETVQLHAPPSQRLIGCFIDQPAVGAITHNGGINIRGWAIGQDRRVISVRARSQDQILNEVPVAEPRSDVTQVYPSQLGAATCGFDLWTDLAAMPMGETELSVEAILENGEIEPLGLITTRRQA